MSTNPENKLAKLPGLMAYGLVMGAFIAFIDNVAFQGEVSPIVIVALLFVTAAAAGFVWGWPGWNAAATAWICVPLTHLVKHMLGLPDSIHPNTYNSIFLLALFTLLITAIGLTVGALIHGFKTRE